MNNIIDIKRVENSPIEPIDLTEAKKQLIITSSDDDTLITSLITRSRKVIENFCHVSIVQKTITLIADLYQEWELPYGPVTGIQTVSTRSANEGSGPATYETPNSNWNTEGEEFVSFIPAGVPGFNVNKPFRGYFEWGPFASPYAQTPGNRYRIVYTAGYTTVPEDLKQAILIQLAWLYEHKGEETGFTICEQAQYIAISYQRKLWI